MILWVAFAVFTQIAFTSMNVQAKTVTIPLKGVIKGGVNTLEALTAHLAAVKQIKATRGVVKLTDLQTLYYYGPISVGGQIFQVLFDTGSTDLVVPAGSLCPAKTTSVYCKNHPVYRNTKTVVKGKTFSQIYGIGAMSGFVAQDVVNVAGIQVTRQQFGVATSIDDSTKAQKYDGIMGMSYTKLSSFQGVPVFLNMINQKQVSQPIFAFYLSRTTANGGELTLGGINANRIAPNEKFTFANFVSQVELKIQVQSIFCEFKTGRRVYTKGVTKALVDTGSGLNYCSFEILNALNKDINGTFNGGVYTVDCNNVKNFPNCYYKISGKEFLLKPDEYILKTTSKNKQVCTSGFVGTDDINDCVIGLPFLSKYYTQFNMQTNQVGFVLAK